MLIILAGITLNAVIGEDGIIFQAKDTKNMISNETQYDNQQLAQLQNELKDNELYSGIGIIPGTDTGGGSEGGENGTGGTNQGGSNTGTNTGGSTNQGGNTNNPGTIVNPGNNQQGPSIGGNAQDPIIRVVDGEMVAASFYRSDVTIQIYTQDRTQKVKYILSSTVPEINNLLYPSGLVKELDIENGGTLTFTRDGEYTITAYAYDTQGQKSNPVVMWFKRETGATAGRGITLTASGNPGENGWYTSNVTIRVLGTDAGSSRVTYRVQGNVYERGTIGNYADTYEYEIGEITPREIEIANGTTIKVATDGWFTITAYTYDDIGNRISTSDPLEIKRDATRPVISSFTGEQVIQNDIGQGFRITVNAIDRPAELNPSEITKPTYTYQYKLAKDVAYNEQVVETNTSKLYQNLDVTKTYDMYVIVTDEAGNRVSSDVISKPAFWISSNPNQSEGEIINEGKEGSLQYTRSPEIEFTFKGQDSNNVDISKVEYEVNGRVAAAGSITGKETKTYTSLNEPIAHKEEYLSSNGEDKATQKFKIAIDGDWTVHVHTYNKEGELVTTNTIRICRDTVAPVVSTFEVTTTSYTTADATASVDTFGVSGERTDGGYSYYYNTTNQGTKHTTHSYTGMTRETDFDKELTVIAKDKAGNTSAQTKPTNTIYYLAHRAVAGDYIDYNAGVWTETKPNPTTHLTTGGVTQNQLISNSEDGHSGWVCQLVDGDIITALTVSTPVQMFISSDPLLYTNTKQVTLPGNTSNNTEITTITSSFEGTKMWLTDSGNYTMFSNSKVITTRIKCDNNPMSPWTTASITASEQSTKYGTKTHPATITEYYSIANYSAGTSLNMIKTPPRGTCTQCGWDWSNGSKHHLTESLTQQNEKTRTEYTNGMHGLRLATIITASKTTMTKTNKYGTHLGWSVIEE